MGTRIIPLLLACLVTALAAAEKQPTDPLLEKALTRLEEKLSTKFEIAFPNLDIDAHLKQPLGMVMAGDKKVAATKPLVNPHDGAGTIEWLIGPGDVANFGSDHLGVSMHFDREGGFRSIVLLSLGDDWTVDPGKGVSQLRRNKDEAGFEFYNRAIQTYRGRAKKAKDPAQAALFLQTFDKMARAIQTSYREVLAEPKQEGQ